MYKIGFRHKYAELWRKLYRNEKMPSCCFAYRLSFVTSKNKFTLVVLSRADKLDAIVVFWSDDIDVFFGYHVLVYLTLPYLTLRYLTRPETFFMCDHRAYHTVQSICTHTGSKEAVWCKKVPFGSGITAKLQRGGEKSWKSQVLGPLGEFPVKQKAVNNFQTVQKFQQSNKKIRVKESICQIRSGTPPSGENWHSTITAH